MTTSEALNIPALCLLAVIGLPDAARRGFVNRHFLPEEVCATLEDARERLAQGLIAVLSGPYLTPEARAPLVPLAREQDVRALAVVLDFPPEAPADPPGADHERLTLLRLGLGGPDSPQLTVAGFQVLARPHTPQQAARLNLRRVPLPPDRRERHGPFDLIGDVHGCLPELLELLGLLGYSVGAGLQVTPPPGRTLVFLGDLTDRGPDSPGVLRLVMGMVRAGTALCVQGNHDAKLLRALEGHEVKVTHGLEVTLSQLAEEPPEFLGEVRAFLAGLPSHLLLDDGRLVAAHAGLPAHLQGRDSRRVWAFALYGDVDRSAQSDDGLPLRRDWAASYHGAALVAYGHTPVRQPRWKNRTVNLDTGGVFGGTLSALRYPELDTLSVAARAVYREAGRAILEVPEGESGT